MRVESVAVVVGVGLVRWKRDLGIVELGIVGLVGNVVVVVVS